MATSSKGYALTGVLAGGRRRRSNNPLVKQAPNNAGPVVVSDTLFSTPVSGAYTLTALGGSYSLAGGSATLTYTPYKPILISSIQLTLGSSATPGAKAVTVPADAQAVIILSGVTPYTTPTTPFLSLTSSFAGTFTVINPTNNRNISLVGYAAVNSTGSHTITPVWNENLQEGPTFWVIFVKNINPGDFVRDIDTNATGTGTGNASVTLNTTGTDLLLAIDSQDVDIPSTMSGYTSLGSAVVMGELYEDASRIQQCNSPGTSTTTVTGTGNVFAAVSAISIKYGVPTTGYTLTAQGGAYSLAGGTASVLRSKKLIASGGSYNYTGASAVLTWAPLTNNYVLTALGGSYAYTGASVGISRNRKLTSNGGAYTVTGGTATLLRSKRLVTTGGSYALTGASALVSRNRVLTSSGGSYTYTGSSANLLRSKYLLSSGGSYSVTGASANILKSKVLVASAGVYTYTGGTATLLRSKYLNGSGGIYSLVGSSANITWGSVGGAVWPPVHLVLLGTIYGPTGIEYTGTLDVNGIKYDITTGQLVKPINDKVVMSI